jgi:hypothetical protein
VTLRALAFLMAVSTAHAEGPTQPQHVIEARWVSVVQRLPARPATCFDLARWLCAAEATSAFGKGREPDTSACLQLHDVGRDLDVSRDNKRRCAAVFTTAIRKTRDYFVSMRALAESEGRHVPKPDLSHRAILRGQPLRALLASVFRDALR